jgi:hypothetical protein
MHRGEEADLLQERHPGAFLLLCQIARRARWKRDPCAITGLHFGQAMIGDWKTAGLDSEKSYRHAKSVLERAGIAAFRGANKGTIATLVSTGIFSLETDGKGEQTGDPSGGVKGERKGRPGATKNKDTRRKEFLGERESGREAREENSPADLGPCWELLISLRTEWGASPVPSEEERTEWQWNRAAAEAIESATWDHMRRFMAHRFAERDARWQPVKRLAAIRTIGDIAAHATSWAQAAGAKPEVKAKPWPEEFERWAKERFPTTPARALWLSPQMRQQWEEDSEAGREAAASVPTQSTASRTLEAGNRRATETIL